MSKTFKTPKGTELPFLNLKGKDYLLVPHRVLWMREEHPEWSIESEFLELNEKIAIARATIRNGDGKIVAQGTKSETPQGFSEFIEKAESGAIGRALAFCGYGTQFAQELETGDHVADAPLSSPKPNSGQSPQLNSKIEQVLNMAMEPLLKGGSNPLHADKSISSLKKDDLHWEIPFGKFKGQNIYAVPLKELKDYANYLVTQANQKQKPVDGAAKEFVGRVREMAGLPREA